MDRFTRHKQLVEKLHNTYISKNTDYGNSFSDTFQELGPITALTRMYDKFNRIKSFFKNGDYLVKDESVIDTLLDLANYCLMTVIEIEAQKENEESSFTEDKYDFKF